MVVKQHLCPYCLKRKDWPHESKLVIMSTWDPKNNCKDENALPMYRCSDCGKEFKEIDLNNQTQIDEEEPKESEEEMEEEEETEEED